MIAAVALNMKHKKQKKIVMTCVILFFSVGEVGVFVLLVGGEGYSFLFKGKDTDSERGDDFSMSNQMSIENNLGWFGYIGDYTTQLYRDYSKI